MIVLPAIVGWITLFDRVTPTTVVARLLLVWAVVSVLRRKVHSVGEWSDDVHLVAAGLAWAAFGLMDRVNSVLVVLILGCFLEALVVTGLINGWWERAPLYSEGQADALREPSR